MAKAADDCDDDGVMLFMVDAFPRRVRGELFCMVAVAVVVDGMGRKEYWRAVYFKGRFDS
jgi:hypothetical protein